MDREPGALETLPTERLEGEITALAAHINAATARWLLLIAEFDRREGWAQWGCKSCAHWLSYRCGLSPAAAREHVRVARALEHLPQIAAAFGRGELGYSQVRAITRVASGETEHGLAEIARHATAAQLETVVRAYRGVLEVELGAREPEHRRRWVRCSHDDDGSLLISARLPAEEGALVVAALEAGRDAVRAGRGAPRPGVSARLAGSGVAGAGGGALAAAGSASPAGGGALAAAGSASPAGGSASAETTQIGDKAPELGFEAAGERTAVSNADALVLMAETMLASGPAERSTADSYQVVVHVDTAALAKQTPAGEHRDTAAGDGRCELEHGPPLHPETVRRLACDGSVVRILERDGRPLSVGRRTRTIPPALRRALMSRDRWCRFPGCAQTRFLHAHHLDHWAHGGRTDLANLIQLCSHHHRLVHEGGYTIEHRPRDGTLRFRRPDGTAIPDTPTPQRGQLQQVLREHRAARLPIDEETCAPRVAGDRIHLPWIVDGLAETDSRLREPTGVSVAA